MKKTPNGLLLKNVGNGSLKGLTKAINAGADVNVGQPFGLGWPALLIAIFQNHFQIIDKLIKAGANVNIKNTGEYIWTPLTLAIYYKRYEIVDRLLMANVNVNDQNSDGNSCLTNSI